MDTWQDNINERTATKKTKRQWTVKGNNFKKDSVHFLYLFGIKDAEETARQRRLLGL